jgi:hypothetical protein
LLIPLTLAVSYEAFTDLLAAEAVKRYRRMFTGFDMAFFELAGAPPAEGAKQAEAAVSSLPVTNHLGLRTGPIVRKPLQNVTASATSPTQRGSSPSPAAAPLSLPVVTTPVKPDPHPSHGHAHAHAQTLDRAQSLFNLSSLQSRARSNTSGSPVLPRKDADKYILKRADFLAFFRVLRPDVEAGVADRLFDVFDGTDTGVVSFDYLLSR